MLRFAVTRLSKSPSIVVAGGILHSVIPILRPVSTPTRRFHATDTHANTFAMINIAINYARSGKLDNQYAFSLRMLEQSLASQPQEGHDGDAIGNTKGMIWLAISTILTESGNTEKAIQTLHRIQALSRCCLPTRVAAIESLIGLNLELGLDDNSSGLYSLKYFEREAQQSRDESWTKVLKARAQAIKGLVNLVCGDLDSAKTFFQGCEDEDFTGNAALSYGEFLHVTGDFAAAKAVYERVISELTKKEDFCDPLDVAACNMASGEVLLAATCALGQLQSHMGPMGNYADAMDKLNKALDLAEKLFGKDHPKFGTVLTCIGLMHRYMDLSGQSSSVFIQEGLFKLAVRLLNAPMKKDGTMKTAANQDIEALARGGYAGVLLDKKGARLCVDEDRKLEGLRMLYSAKTLWKNHRLSLNEVLEIYEADNMDTRRMKPVIDTRICRAL